MIKKKNKIIKIILYIITILCMTVPSIIRTSSYYLYRHGIISSFEKLNPGFIFYIVCIPLLFLYIYEIIKSKRKIDIIDIIFYFFLLTSFFSIIFAKDIHIAILGKTVRYQGFLAFLSYYLLLLNWKAYAENNDYSKLIKIIIIIAFVNLIYGNIQLYSNLSFILKNNTNKYTMSGLCVNQNFFGTLMCTVLSLITFKYLQKDNKSFKQLFLIVLFFEGLVNCQSTGPLLTYFIMIIVIFIYLIKEKSLNVNKLIMMITSLAFTYFIVYLINKYYLNSTACELCNINKTISSGGTGRVDIWKNTLSIIKNHFVYGVGYENYYLYYTFPSRQIIDNAHNVYLHTLAELGILGFLPFASLLLVTLKKCFKFKSIIFLMMVSFYIAYSIQAFANINVIQITPMYFVIIGLILSYEEKSKKVLKNK